MGCSPSQVLDSVKVVKEMDRETLINVSRTSLRTKVGPKVADILTEVSAGGSGSGEEGGGGGEGEGVVKNKGGVSLAVSTVWNMYSSTRL